MAKPKLSSLLVLGVEWGFTGTTRTRTATDRMAADLIDQLERRQLKATWAFQDLSAAWVARIRQASVAQEVALDATLSTPRDRREAFAFAASLRDRVELAASRGLRIQSIVLDPTGCAPYHSLARLGFRTVRPGSTSSQRSVQTVQAQPLRYGLWGLPVSARFPQSTRFMHHFASQQIASGMRRAALGDAAMHVVFDVSRLAAQGDSARRAIGRLLTTAAELRDEQQLHVARLIDVERLVRIETSARPAQSILRRVS